MKKILFIIASLFISLSVFSQSNSLYFNKKVFQTTQLNPARQFNCRFSLGLPALSSIYLDLQNRGFKYNDIYYPKADVDSFYYDLDQTYDKLNDVNYMFLHDKISLGYVGFWIRDFYVTLDANFVNEFNFAIPKSIFLIKDGNYFEDGSYISATDMAIDLNAYTEVGLGVSKEIIPGLTIGGKIKLLKGISNFSTNNFMLDWHVSTEDSATYDYTFNSSFNYQTSSPIKITPEYDDNNNLNGLDIDDSFQDGFEDDPFNTTRNIIRHNTGLGFDFGVIYEYDKFEFSASVLDLGFISWKNNPFSVETENSEFVFSGVDVGKYIGDISIVESLKDKDVQDSIITSFQEDIIDTLMYFTQPTIDSAKYTTTLNTKLNFAASYTPLDWLTLGFLYHGYHYNKKLHSNFTLSGNIMFWKGWSYTLSYTMFKQSFNNLGMGFSYNVGPVQMYMVFDNFSIAMLGSRYGISPDKPYNEGIATNWVKNTKLLTFHFGINFMFGCGDTRDYGIID